MKTSLALLALLAIQGAPAAAETLRLGGTGTGVATFRALAPAIESQYKSLRLEISPSLGSGGGIRALIDGSVDVAVSARPLTAGEKASGLSVVEVGRTPLAFAAGKGTGAGRFTLEEIAEVYEGKRTAWPNLERIRLILRPSGDSDIASLRAISLRMSQAVDLALKREGMVVADNDDENVQLLEKTPGAFGMTSVAMIRAGSRDIRTLPLNGAFPTPEALEKKSYPLQRTLYLVLKATPSPVARVLVDYVSSPSGRDALRKLGYLPAAER